MVEVYFMINEGVAKEEVEKVFKSVAKCMSQVYV
jgi:hypothetical protein